LGSATTDAVIIRNLPLHLADLARTWLEHLLPSQIYSWDDLVRMFVGELLGHVRAPWELLGPAGVHREARRIALRLHTTLLQSLHCVPECC
jgi:hypothetical protein